MLYEVITHAGFYLNNALMSFPGNLTEQAAYQIAGELGYDIAALKTLAGSADVDGRLNRNYQLANVLGLQGTPAFIRNNFV